MKIHTIDLNFSGVKGAIACFVIESSLGPVLIETGPHSCLPQLESELKILGYSLDDIKHVLVTHIHLDHAGAAWCFAEKGANIYVHPLGSKHLASPEKLYSSAKRIYKDEMERLWGELNPIAPERIRMLKDREAIELGNLNIVAHYSPGHAVHHLCFEAEGELFTGDVAGVCMTKGPVQAPCPPPDISIEDWKLSIEKMIALNPKKLHLTHFGEVNDPRTHLLELTENLDKWSSWIKKNGLDGDVTDALIAEFEAIAYTDRNGDPLNGEVLKQYQAANPAWMSVYGLRRYWQIKQA